MEYKFNNFSFKILNEDEQKTFGYKTPIDNNIVYIDDEQIWLKCPCGCEEVYKLNTRDGISPR